MAADLHDEQAVQAPEGHRAVPVEEIGVVRGDAPTAIPLASEAVMLARQAGAPALITSSLLVVGATVAGTDPGQARARLNESRELGTALGYHSARDLVWATAIAFLLNDSAGTLELGSHAIASLQWGGDHIRVGFALYMIAGALAATRPDAAAIIQGAAATCIPESPIFAQLVSSPLTEALGEQRARELRAQGADMRWDQALAYTLTQACAVPKLVSLLVNCRFALARPLCDTR